MNAVMGWLTFLAMPAKVSSGVFFGSKKMTAAGFPPKGLVENAATNEKEACFDMLLFEILILLSDLAFLKEVFESFFWPYSSHQILKIVIL